MTHQRFVLNLSEKLHNEINAFAHRHGMSKADIGRAALKSHLKNKKREARRNQLAECCRLFCGRHNGGK